MSDAETQGRLVLGGILPSRKDRLDLAMRKVKTEFFTSRWQHLMWRMVERMYDSTGSVLTRHALATFLRKENAAVLLQMESLYDALVAEDVDDGDFSTAVDALKDIATEKATGDMLATALTIMGPGTEVEKETLQGHDDVRSYLQKQVTVIERDLGAAPVPEGDLRDERDDLLADYQRRKQLHAEGALMGVRMGIENIDRKMNGMQRGELILCVGYSSDGKAVGLDERLITPTGPLPMRDVQVGTALCNTYGGVSRVVGVYPQGVRRMYRVTFSDGSSVRATDDHLWTVRRRMPVKVGGRQITQEVERVYTTEQIVPMLRWTAGRPYLPDIAPVQTERPLPASHLPPYLVGLLLGDGSLHHGSITFTTPDDELAASLRDHLPAGYEVVVAATRPGATVYRIRGGRGFRNELLQSGVPLVPSPEKYVPEAYLWAPAEDRLALLQGLMDTDGWVEKGSGDFASSSERLRDDVMHLARSLGIRASQGKPKDTHYLKEGERHEARLSHRTALGYHPDLFRLRRQRDLLTPPQRVRRRVFKSIEYIGDEEAQCIRVDATDSLFLVEGFIPTHNSSLCVQAAWSAAVEQQKNVVFFTTETLREQINRKLMARHSKHPLFGLPDGLNSRDIKAGTLTATQEQMYGRVVDDFTQNENYGHVYVAQMARNSTISTLESRLKRIAQGMRVDLVIMDYLALLNPENRRQSDREQLASIVREAKQVAVTFGDGQGVPFMSPWQVSRAAREKADKEGERYTSAALAETSEATNSADSIISILAPMDNVDRHCEVTAQVLKNRDGERADGLYLDVDYATSWFRAKSALSGASGSFAPATTAVDDDPLEGLDLDS